MTGTTFTSTATLADYIAARLQVPATRAKALLEHHGSPVTYQIGVADVCKRAEAADWMAGVAQRESIGKTASCGQCGENRNLPGGILCVLCRHEIECAPMYPEGTKS